MIITYYVVYRKYADVIFRIYYDNSTKFNTQVPKLYKQNFLLKKLNNILFLSLENIYIRKKSQNKNKY